MFDENQKTDILYAWHFRCETKRFGLVTKLLAPSKESALRLARQRYPKFAVQLIAREEYDEIAEGTAKDKQANALARFRLQTERLARGRL